MYIANIRVTHKDTPHEVIDRMILKDSDILKFYADFLSKDDIDEAVLLQTCNRFEVYFSGKDEINGMVRARKFFLDYFGASIAKHIIMDSYLDTLGHLFRVVSSIDSLIVGENQIQAQVKEALEYASIHNQTGRILEPIFQKALSVGKRIRTETNISDGKVSISSAAVELANQNNKIDNKSIMIIGTGKMASLLADNLSDFDVNEMFVVGRTPERLQTFCDSHSGTPVDIEHLSSKLGNVDILFSATSCPRVLITKDTIESALEGRTRPLTLIDIAMPADIDPTVTELQNVDYFCIDDLREISSKNLTARQGEITKSEQIIQRELERLKFKLENLHIEHFLSHLNIYTEEIRQKELDKALKMAGGSALDPKISEIIEGLSKSLTKKIMHNFLKEVRKNPNSSIGMEKFVNIFMGNGHVPKHPHEKAKE